MAEEYADGINRPQECRETEKIFLVAIVSLGTGARRTKDLGDDRTRRSRGDGGDFEERKSVNIGVGRTAICEPFSDRVDVSLFCGIGDCFREIHVQCALVLPHRL